MTIPPEALDLLDAFVKDLEAGEDPAETARTYLTVAASNATAAERDRIRQLALTVSARCCQSADGVAVLGAAFADLLADDQP
jgi:hypothetical protein